MYLLAPMLSKFTDVIFRTENIYELFRDLYFLIAKSVVDNIDPAVTRKNLISPVSSIY